MRGGKALPEANIGGRRTARRRRSRDLRREATLIEPADQLGKILAQRVHKTALPRVDGNADITELILYTYFHALASRFRDAK
jgi:hypothetical protein